jgi:hypothetical protein
VPGETIPRLADHTPGKGGESLNAITFIAWQSHRRDKIE